MPAHPIVSTTTAARRPAAHRARARPNLGVPAAIGLGGALGGVARYEIALAAPTSAGGFPWATWWINLAGALVLGVVVTLVVERWPPTRYVRPFVGIGVCGGFTTWSTFMTETALLLRHHRVVLAVLYR